MSKSCKMLNQSMLCGSCSNYPNKMTFIHRIAI